MSASSLHSVMRTLLHSVRRTLLHSVMRTLLHSVRRTLLHSVMRTLLHSVSRTMRRFVNAANSFWRVTLSFVMSSAPSCRWLCFVAMCQDDFECFGTTVQNGLGRARQAGVWCPSCNKDNTVCHCRLMVCWGSLSPSTCVVVAVPLDRRPRRLRRIHVH